MSRQITAELKPLFESISADQYGLHCGIFTKSLQVAFDAIRDMTEERLVLFNL